MMSSDRTGATNARALVLIFLLLFVPLGMQRFRLFKLLFHLFDFLRMYCMPKFEMLGDLGFELFDKLGFIVLLCLMNLSS